MDAYEKIQITKKKIKNMTLMMAFAFMFGGVLFKQINNMFGIGLDGKQVMIFTYGLIAVGIYDLIVMLPLHLYILNKKEKEIMKSLEENSNN